jgi:hypothetical protein
LFGPARTTHFFALVKLAGVLDSTRDQTLLT